MKKDSIANKIVNFINGSINNFVIIVLIFLFLISSYAIFDKYQVYEDAKISQDVEDLRPKDNDVTFSLPELRKLNPEINGWIKIYDTNIDYPFVKGNDNTKYLTHNYKGEDTGVGSIFIDYRNDFNFQDDYTILYGHNLQGGFMFSNIIKYKSKKYFKSHLDGELHTLKGDYKLDIFSYASIDASKDDLYDLINFKNGGNAAILKLIKEKAIHYKDIGIKPTDKLVLLSTCDTSGTYTRSVLLARLTKETDVLTSITTKASKLAEEEVTLETEKAYEAPPVKEEEEIPKPKPSFTIPIYYIFLIAAALIVIIIYIVLFTKKSKLQKKRMENKEQAKNQTVTIYTEEDLNNGYTKPIQDSINNNTFDTNYSNNQVTSYEARNANVDNTSSTENTNNEINNTTTESTSNDDSIEIL